MKKNKLPEFIPVNDVPGPGYYYDEEKMNLNYRSGKNDLNKLNLHKKIFSLYIFLYIFFHNICLIVIIKSLY